MRSLSDHGVTLQKTIDPSPDKVVVSKLMGLLPATLREDIQQFQVGDLVKPITEKEVRNVCIAAKDVQLLPSETCAEAAGLMSNIVKDIDAWQWPETGVNVRLQYFRFQKKIRHIFEADGFTIVFLKVLSDRWATRFCHRLKANHGHDSQHHVPPQPGQAVDAEPLDLFWSALQQDFLLSAATSKEHDKGYPECGTVLPSAIAAAVTSAKVNALAEEQSVDIAVVCSDVKDFSGSLSHDLLLSILECCGVEPRWLRFFKRFLEAPWTDKNGQRCALKRSTPLGFSMSTFLGELALLLVERHVQNAVPKLHIMRIHDDFYFLGAFEDVKDGWKAFGKCLDSLGMEINFSKSGSVVVGHEGTDVDAFGELPVGPVRWKHLKLTKQGHWLPDIEKMRASLPDILSNDGEPILKKLALFNDCMRACRRMLGKPCFAMGRPHLCACMEALEKIELELCGGQRASAWLRQLLQRSFPDCQQLLSDALLYWPALLGGLGLEDPQSELRYSLRAFQSSSNWMTAPAKPKPKAITQLCRTRQSPEQAMLAMQGIHVINEAEAKLKSWKMAMRRWLSVTTKPCRCGKNSPSLPEPLEKCRENYGSGQLEELACLLAEVECTYGTAALLPAGLEPIWLLKRIRALQKSAQNLDEEWVDVSVDAHVD
jgi:hypothetical protein